jgi:hypothetical protein
MFLSMQFLSQIKSHCMRVLEFYLPIIHHDYVMQDPLKFVLAAGIGTLLLVSLVVLRIYLVSQTNALA